MPTYNPEDNPFPRRLGSMEMRDPRDDLSRKEYDPYWRVAEIRQNAQYGGFVKTVARDPEPSTGNLGGAVYTAPDVGAGDGLECYPTEALERELKGRHFHGTHEPLARPNSVPDVFVQAAARRTMRDDQPTGCSGSAKYATSQNPFGIEPRYRLGRDFAPMDWDGHPRVQHGPVTRENRDAVDAMTAEWARRNYGECVGSSGEKVSGTVRLSIDEAAACSAFFRKHVYNEDDLRVALLKLQPFVRVDVNFSGAVEVGS